MCASVCYSKKKTISLNQRIEIHLVCAKKYRKVSFYASIGLFKKTFSLLSFHFVDKSTNEMGFRNRLMSKDSLIVNASANNTVDV